MSNKHKREIKYLEKRPSLVHTLVKGHNKITRFNNNIGDDKCHV